MAIMDVVPNQTLYVSHVYEKMKKEGEYMLILLFWGREGGREHGDGGRVNKKTDEGSWWWCNAETKKCLYALFGQFGRIIDVVCMKTESLRGRAWIVFADVASASNALRAMQDFPFFGKPLVRLLVCLFVCLFICLDYDDDDDVAVVVILVFWYFDVEIGICQDEIGCCSKT